MGGVQSRYENKGEGGRITEVANFDFRDFKKEEGGIGKSGDDIFGNDKLEIISSQRQRNGSWVGEDGGGRNVERIEYFACFHNRIELINGRSKYLTNSFKYHK